MSSAQWLGMFPTNVEIIVFIVQSISKTKVYKSFKNCNQLQGERFERHRRTKKY